MRYFLYILLLPTLCFVFTGCKNPSTCIQETTKKDLLGVYSRNISEGWSRPKPDMEVVPDIPHYQLLELASFGKFIFTPDIDANITYTGKWNFRNDTLRLEYNKGHAQLFISEYQNGNGCDLRPVKNNEQSFSRANWDLDHNSMKNRKQVSINCYENGVVKSYGQLKKYAEGDRTRPILKQNGKWRYYNEEGQLVKTIKYRRGKEIKRKIKNTANIN